LQSCFLAGTEQFSLPLDLMVLLVPRPTAPKPRCQTVVVSLMLRLVWLVFGGLWHTFASAEAQQ
jgi:hypothetical protein